MTYPPFPHRETVGTAYLKVHTRSAQRLHLTACGLDIAGREPDARRGFKGYRAPTLTDVATLRALGGSACGVCLHKVGEK